MAPAGIYLAKSGSQTPPVLPADAVTRTFGIFGVKGSGKTTTARVLAEGIAKLGGHVVILDPVGVWWGITRRGEGPGVPGIVLGGEHGDVPLEEAGGQLVAELAVARQWPAVVVDLKLLRKGQAQGFMADFLEGVYHLNRRPLHVVFEEADRALPQNPRGMDPTLGRVLGAAEDIVKLGRSRGLGSTFISQRMATVTKNVVEQVEALILHAQPGPRDRAAVKSWVEANGDPKQTAKVLDSMASLPQGEAWLYSPAWMGVLERIRVKAPRTLDSSSTPTDDERDREEQAQRAPVDLDELRRMMAETVERQEANDPKALRKQVDELEAYREAVERIVQEWGEPMPPRTNVADVVLAMKRRAGEPQRVLVPDREAMVELAQVVAALEALGDEWHEQVGVLRDHLDGPLTEVLRGGADLAKRILDAREQTMKGLDAVAALPPEGKVQGSRSTNRESRSVKDETTPVHRPAPKPASDGALSDGAGQLVDGLSRFYPLWLDRGQLALLLGRGKNSSTLTQQLAEAVAAGALERSVQGSYRVAHGQNGSSTPTLMDLRASYREALPDGPRALFDVLLSREELSREELFRTAGFSPTSSTPVTHLKLLTDNGLAEKIAGGVVLGPAVR